jgi:HK97 gp10 family phage protein
MSDLVTVKISGLDELQKRLEEIPEDLRKKGMRTALSAGADIIRDGMVELAPKDTGFLAEHFNIKTSVKNGGMTGQAFIGPAGKIDYMEMGSVHARTPTGRWKKRKGQFVMEAGMVARISVEAVARFLEFGTSKMAKRPFMTQTFETKKGNALDAMIGKLRDWLDKQQKR